MVRRIRVLIVDDSALVREVLSRELARDTDLEVVGTAADPFAARDQILKLSPDVLTLDVEMPRMDGVEFLRRLMPQYPLPVIMVSALTGKGMQNTLAALEAGAVDFVLKPRSDVARGLAGMLDELKTKIKIGSTANVARWKHREPVNREPVRVPSESTERVIAIGASTGGIEALHAVVTRFPAATPGVVIVQHMPPGFTAMFAERLNTMAAMEVKEASDGDRVMAGRILVAPGGKHMRVLRQGGQYLARVAGGEPVNGHCPSVEVLLQSVAESAGPNAVGAVLTGMGRDGADALKAMRQAGARCLAQDEATSVVFGMPREAYERGGAECLVPLPRIADTILEMLEGKA